MQLKFKLKLVIIMMLVLAILVVAIIYINKDTYVETTDEDLIDPNEEEIVEYRNTYFGNIQKVPDITKYDTVKTCINKFYVYYALIYDQDIINTDSEYGLDYYKEVVCNFLSEDYLQRNDITADNVDSKLEKIESYSVEVYTMYYLTEFENVEAYFVKGLLRNSSDSADTKEFSIIVYLDTENMTFELDLDNTLGIDFDELYDSQEVEFELPESVTNRKINIFSYTTTSYEDIATMLFNNTIKLMVYNTDKAYELLTDEAKSVYKSESELATYVENNKKKLLLSSFKIYEIDYEDTVFVLNVYDSSSNYEFRFYFENGFSTYKYSFSEI